MLLYVVHLTVNFLNMWDARALRVSMISSSQNKCVSFCNQIHRTQSKSWFDLPPLICTCITHLASDKGFPWKLYSISWHTRRCIISSDQCSSDLEWSSGYTWHSKRPSTNPVWYLDPGTSLLWISNTSLLGNGSTTSAPCHMVLHILLPCHQSGSIVKRIIEEITKLAYIIYLFGIWACSPNP
jgi:hypothetical protein